MTILWSSEYRPSRLNFNVCAPLLQQSQHGRVWFGKQADAVFPTCTLKRFRDTGHTTLISQMRKWRQEASNDLTEVVFSSFTPIIFDIVHQSFNYKWIIKTIWPLPTISLSYTRFQNDCIYFTMEESFLK